MEEKEHALLDGLIANYSKQDNVQREESTVSYIELALKFNDSEQVKHISKLYVQLNGYLRHKTEYFSYCNSIVEQLFETLRKTLKSSGDKLHVG